MARRFQETAIHVRVSDTGILKLCHLIFRRDKHVAVILERCTVTTEISLDCLSTIFSAFIPWQSESKFCISLCIAMLVFYKVFDAYSPCLVSARHK